MDKEDVLIGTGFTLVFLGGGIGAVVGTCIFPLVGTILFALVGGFLGAVLGGIPLSVNYLINRLR
jgi:hypothetical protein